MLDGELGNNASNYEDGSGLLFSGDLQYTFNEFNRNYLIGTASLTHNRFSFELGTSEIDFTATDLKIGGLFLRKIQNFSIYGGIEATIYSDGDIEYKPSGNEFEVEREDPLSLRLGVALAIDPSIDLRADLYALGEKTFAFAVDFKI
jgi:hypothetical protein